MSGEKLKDYGSVPSIIVDATTTIDPNVSWVEAHVVKAGVQREGEQESLTLSSASASGTYRDLPFAIAFMMHFALMVTIGIIFGSYKTASAAGAADEEEYTTTAFNDFESGAVILIALSSMATSVLISFVITFVYIPKCPETVVSAFLLLFTIVHISLAIIFVILLPSIMTVIFSFLWIGIYICYYPRWKRYIPYTAAVLKIATEGISCHWGMYIVSFASSMLSLVWWGFWIYTFNGLRLAGDFNTEANSTNSGSYYDNSYDDGGSISGKVTAKLFFLILSLYWTLTVLTNITQTTIAGVIATYCLENPSTAKLCSSHKPVSQSLRRALTTSFGSICFGSLLKAIISALRTIADYSRAQARGNNANAMALLYCVLQCILSILEDIIRYFNQWSYVFVGIYGTSYLESGKMVIELFGERGCQMIMTDGLNMYVLNAIVWITGLICGVIGGIIASVSEGMNAWAGFGLAFLIGIIFSFIMANTLQGAIKGVLICYVDHPGKLNEIHPEDTKMLGDAIALVFPSARQFQFTNDNVTV